MSTGDLKNNVKKLQTQIKAVKYTGKLDLDGIKDGSPTAFLPMYHYIFTSYSNKLNRDISNSNNELYGKSDLRFIEAIYKILRDMFSYKPPITREQFFLPGFAERKVIMATDILRHIHSSYTPPSSSSSYKLASRMEKKQHDIQTKVQDCNQNDAKSKCENVPTKPRKVASKTGPDLTEAIVLPRYISSSSSYGWRDNRAAARTTPTPSDISDAEFSQQVHTSSNSNVNVEDTNNDMTKQFTEHITNTLALLNNQVGKISTSLQKVEDKIAVSQTPTPRVEETIQIPVTSDKNSQLETLLSKVILLENRMTLLEHKVEDIQTFCTIMLENRNNSNHSNHPSTGPEDLMSTPPRAMQSEEKEKGGGTKEMHPSYVSAFAPVVDLGVSSSGRNDRYNVGFTTDSRVPIDNKDNDEDDNDVTIEDVTARDSGVEGKVQPCKPVDMKFMKTLVGPNDSIASLSRDQEDSSILLPELHNKNSQYSGTVQAWTTQETTAGQKDNSFGNIFSPIRGHTGNNSMINVPFGEVEEDFESRRLSSTPNKASKADLDTSTLSRVNRIMQMMKETQQQFQN